MTGRTERDITHRAGTTSRTLLAIYLLTIVGGLVYFLLLALV